MPPDQKVFDAARELGFTEHRIRSGGHYEFIHPRVGSLFTSATTSDYRSVANFIGQMERAAGRRIARPNAGKYRHVTVAAADMRCGEADRERRELVDEIDADAERIRDEFNLLTECSTRSAASRCRELIAAYDELVDRATTIAHLLPPIHKESQ